MVAGAAATASVDEQTDVSDDVFDESAAEKLDTKDDRTETKDDENESQPAIVTFEEQATVGEQVVVQEVTMASGGFVTIHDRSLLEGNVVGSVVGTSDFLERGPQEDVEVSLDEPITDDRTLIAMPHRDTNDNQQYDFVETDGQWDIPYRTPDGQPVTDAATVTVSEEDPVAEGPGEEMPTDAEDRPRVVTVEDATIENLTVENASVFVLVVSEDIAAEEPAEIEEEAEEEPTEENVTEGPVEIEQEPAEENVTEEPVEIEEEPAEIEPPEPPAGPVGPEEEAEDEDNVTAEPDEEEIAVDDGEAEDEETETVQAAINFENQTTDGETVEVERTTLPDSGFVAIYDSGLLEGNIGTSFVGVSEFLEEGASENVEVESEEPLADDETLIAVTHRDTNENQRFDLLETEGEEDSPYLTSDGEPVTDDALVTVAADDENGDVATSDGDTSSTVIEVSG
ncbi:DUF7282 domain-containing protein [Natrinema amylolyticum]|uniref:DUF7282 domain-containing protein n=1 Tax=Natrinema amylolyticum TaxID=2878679 RepID=UPI001CFC2EA8|nr:hypothetical protein [Natrinema amylolyticum]